MKDKDVKKMLSGGARQVLPSEEVKQNIKNRISGGDKVLVYADGGTKKRRAKTPVIIAAAAAVIAAILCAVLIPYYLKNDGTSPLIPNPIDKFTSIDSADDFYVYGAASVGALLSAQEQSSAAAVKSALKSTEYSTQEIADILDGYMPFVEGLIGGSEITAQTAATRDENYDSYEYCLAIGYPHIDGEYSTYILYYNRAISEVKTEDGETEEKYDITGVLCVDGAEYYVDGKYEYETEDGETEEEVTFTVYSGNQPYIRLVQETEQEAGESELAYLYTFYSGGKAVKTVEVEYEQEDGETELQLTAVEGSDKFEFEFFLLGETEMKVKAEINGKKYTITVTVIDEKYYYSFN